MSKEELQIINCQALIDEEFYICLANAEIIKLLEMSLYLQANNDIKIIEYETN